MHYSPADIDEIRRWRKHLIWVCVIATLASGIALFATIGDAFLAGVSEQQDADSIRYVGVIYLWAAIVANRLAKELDPRFYYYWTITALMFLPAVNLIVIISLLMDSGRVLAGPKIYK